MAAERRVALVTGASRGLGAAIARRLATAGFAVAVNHRRSPDQASAVVGAIRAAGGTAQAFTADVTAEDDVGRLVEQIRTELGPIHALVINATGPQPTAGLEALTWRAQLDQLEFFVKSPTLMLQAALPDMKAARAGRVVHIGSDILTRALPGNSAYTAAKAAQLGLARVWARELAPHGITVNTVAPGWIPVERHAGEDTADYVAAVPLGRTGEPEDVAAAVAYLASDAAAFVTGVRLTVNGGFSVD